MIMTRGTKARRPPIVSIQGVLSNHLTTWKKVDGLGFRV